ncbi:MAG: efflux RND transporter periplasmic adaptor subunit [Scytolyngbya sp. HA4215-MV1]|jgi:multidrug efflux pump subunit AcrA (membrane-fusion protein)|nr:efflux RND transporter periplasmic adaptor subunit [Scytolyngbya sp. HA4215-MV1]
MTTSKQSFDEPLKPKHSHFPTLSVQKWGWLLGGALILAGGIWSIVQWTRSPHSEQVVSVPAIAVTTLTIRPQSRPATLDLSGTIRPLEQATLSTRVMGRITQLSLESGDRFQKGEILAQIDVMDMVAQTNQAQSGVAQAQAEVVRSQATFHQLQAQQVEAQASLRLAQINQRRMAQLQAEGAVSQSQLDEANTRFEEAKARLAQVVAGVQQSQAAIAQSRAAVNQAKSGVDSASASERYGTIVAPFDGVVVQKLAYEGEMTAPGTALLKVENPHRLQLELSVPEEKLRWVRVGQSVQVRVDAANQTDRSTIRQIVPSADTTSRSFLVKIPLHNSGRLISGMFGRVTLPFGEPQETILIPRDAFIQRGQLQGVYVVEATAAQPRAVLRWVKTGKVQSGQIEIVSGLTTGDRLITNHIPQLSEGQPVITQP